MLERIVLSYLGYGDLVALRNSCMCLHNFTRELRLSWKIFHGRELHLNRVVSLFVRWAKIGDEGAQQIDPDLFRLRDSQGSEMCPRYLEMECPISARQCRLSHGALACDAEELSAFGAYLEYADLLFLVSAVFDAKFVWKFERYIEALFFAFSEERTVMHRKVRPLCFVLLWVIEEL